jgi:hypothetical protein
MVYGFLTDHHRDSEDLIPDPTTGVEFFRKLENASPGNLNTK